MVKLKILHVITHLAVGGATYNTLYNSEGHIKKGHLVDVVHGYDPVMDIEGDLIEFAKQREVPLFLLKSLVRPISPFKDFLATLKLFLFIKKHQYDVVHTHSSKAGIVGRIAAKMAGVPVIVHTVHGWSYHEHMSFLKKKLYVIIEKIGMKFSSKQIVVTRLDINKGIKEGIGRESDYVVIRSGIDLSQFDSESVSSDVREELGLDPDVEVIGTVTRLSEQKNPYDFIKLALLIKKVRPEVKFIIVGDGQLRDKVEKVIKYKNLEKDVFLLGKRSDVYNCLSAMDIFVLTSKWEGLPRVLPESMGIGIPIVSNKVDGSVEIIKDGKNGFLVDIGDVKTMAQKCVQLMDNSELYSEIVSHAEETVKEFSHLKMIDDLEELFLSSYNSLY